MDWGKKRVKFREQLLGVTICTSQLIFFFRQMILHASFGCIFMTAKQLNTKPFDCGLVQEACLSTCNVPLMETSLLHHPRTQAPNRGGDRAFSISAPSFWTFSPKTSETVLAYSPSNCVFSVLFGCLMSFCCFHEKVCFGIQKSTCE